VKKHLAATGIAFFFGCSSGSGGLVPVPVATPFPPGPNVIDLSVDSGPAGQDYTNGLFASVRICQSGTTECQTIDHMLVDTGSVGVRVLESLLTLELPDVVDAGGQVLAECRPFVDGSMWGPLKTADVVLGGETAAGVAIQLVGESRYALPRDCTGLAVVDLDTLGTNGILGIGVQVSDCGTACTQPVRSRANPGYYFACPDTAGCSLAAVPTSQQVSNPVAALPVDNNGTIIRLPRVGERGAPSASGQMVLGVGTQENNGLAEATLVSLDDYGNSLTRFPVGSLASYRSIVDSGSNAVFFLDTATTGLSMCTGGLSSFYCPVSTENLSATMPAATGTDIGIEFSVANLAKLPSSAYALDNLAGPMPGYPTDPTIPDFDWGLPFFFGRTVYTAIEGKATPAGAGPYLAF
jgi:hypothetical protein